MKAIIVDDESRACSNLHKMLKRYVDANIDVCGVANSTAEAEALINTCRPDVAFLDIEMPDENAFEFLDRVGPVNFEIIFATAYDEFALKALKLNAVDYILKPIRVSDLKAAVERLNERLRYKSFLNTHAISYSAVSQQISDGSLQQSIGIRGTEGLEFISFRSICYIEAQGSYSKFVYIKEDKPKVILSSYPIAHYEDLLPHNMFYRIHRSYMLNCLHLKTIANESCITTFSPSKPLPIGRKRYQSLLDFLRKANINPDGGSGGS